MKDIVSAKGGSAFGGKKLLLIIPVLALIGASCSRNPTPKQQVPAQSSKVGPQVYTNKQYSYSFTYPDYVSISEKDAPELQNTIALIDGKLLNDIGFNFPASAKTVDYSLVFADSKGYAIKTVNDGWVWFDSSSGKWYKTNQYSRLDRSKFNKNQEYKPTKLGLTAFGQAIYKGFGDKGDSLLDNPDDLYLIVDPQNKFIATFFSETERIDNNASSPSAEEMQKAKDNPTDFINIIKSFRFKVTK